MVGLGWSDWVLPQALVRIVGGWAAISAAGTVALLQGYPAWLSGAAVRLVGVVRPAEVHSQALVSVKNSTCVLRAVSPMTA